MKIFLRITLLFLTFSSFSFAQVQCDTVYSVVNELPYYKNKQDTAIMFYMSREILPMLVTCIKRDKQGIIMKLNIVLLIDKKGVVRDVEFPNFELGELSRKELHDKLMTMKGWYPGIRNHKKVCCYHILPLHWRWSYDVYDEIEKSIQENH